MPRPTEPERLGPPPGARAAGVVTAPDAAGALAPARASFSGVGPERSVSPPDTHLAAGPDRLIEVTNGQVAIWSKAGTLISPNDGAGHSTVSLNDFCGTTVASRCFDPRVLYDQYTGRFVVVALQGQTASASRLHILVSKDATPADFSATHWDKYSDPGTVTIDGTDGWLDYPGLGVSPDGVVVSANVFNDAHAFIGAAVRVYDRTELYDGDSALGRSQLTTASAATIQPAHHYGTPPTGTFYLLELASSTELRLWTLTGLPDAPSAATATVSIAHAGSCIRSAPQLGTPKALDTLCGRMMDTDWRDGALWGALTGSDAGGSRSVVHWFEVATPGGTVAQQGAIDVAGEHTFMPALAVNGAGTVALTYTRSSTGRYPEMRYTARSASDPRGTMRTSEVLKASPTFFDDFTGDPERWGDYAGASVDPTDGSIWLAHEFAEVAAVGGDDGGWGTWITQVSLNAPPVADAGADAVVNFGDSVTLDGSASRDSDGSITSYAWRQLAGPSVTLSDADAVSPDFVAPATAGTATFELTVTDDGGASDTDQVAVRINAPPTAEAGTDRTAVAGGAVVLDASASDDSDGHIAAYAWTQTSGTPVTLSDAATATPGFTAPPAGATLGFTLTVTDNDGATDSDTVQVTTVAGGSGGGCTVARGKGGGAVLPVLVFIAMLYLWCRRRGGKARRCIATAGSGWR